MSGIDSLRSVQFINLRGKRFAVLSAEDWEELIDWLETLDDAQIARQAMDELRAAKGNRKRAGWRKWQEARDELL
jgi:hypothetical protein